MSVFLSRKCQVHSTIYSHVVLVKLNFHLCDKVLSVNDPDFRNKIDGVGRSPPSLDAVIQVSVFRFDFVVSSSAATGGVQWKISPLCLICWWWGAVGWYIGCCRSLVGSFRVAVGTSWVAVGSFWILVRWGICCTSICVWKGSSAWEPYNCGVWWQRPTHSDIIVSVWEIQVFWGHFDNCRIKVDAWIYWRIFVVVEGEFDPYIAVLES